MFNLADHIKKEMLLDDGNVIIQRRKGETIVIANWINITLVAISGKRVILNVNAPKCIKIDRAEKITTMQKLMMNEIKQGKGE